jgi:hypothetical protein
MAHFFRVPTGERISTQSITISKNSRVGLYGWQYDDNELAVTADNQWLYVDWEKTVGDVRYYTIKGEDGAVGKVTAKTRYGIVFDWFTARIINSKAPAGDMSVRPITKDVFGSEDPNTHLISTLKVPEVLAVQVPSFTPGDPSNAPLFFRTTEKKVRIGVFAANNGKSERAAVLMLPERGKPSKILIAITHGFGQQAEYYDSIGWNNPVSVPLIQDVTNRFVLRRWAPQVLAARKDMAMLLIVRASTKGSTELGPFAADGRFVAQTLESIAEMTGDSFNPFHVEAFTYSSGILDFNPFLAALQAHVPIEAVYNIDPRSHIAALSVKGCVRKQFLSGVTGGPAAGFEYMPVSRWVNEPDHRIKLPDPKNGYQLGNYLHNHVMPDYTLYLGIETS